MEAKNIPNADRILSAARLAKTDFARNKLTALLIKIAQADNIMMSNPDLPGWAYENIAAEKAGFEQERDQILNDPDMCFTSLEAKREWTSPYADVQGNDNFDMFEVLAKITSNLEIQDVAGDMKALEDSVEDGKIAYETIDNEVTQQLADTIEAVNAAEQALDYDGSTVNIVGMAPDRLQEQIRQAQETLGNIMGGDSPVPPMADARQMALMEIGKHPFHYAVYSARNNLRSIMDDVAEGRELVRAAEGTFTDSLKGALGQMEFAASNGISNATSMALRAGRGAGKEAGELLGKAYDSATWMLTSAKDGLKKISAAVLKSADKAMEFITMGGYSHILEAQGREAYVAAASENPTRGDRVAEALIKAHVKTRGYTAEETSDYIAQLRKSVWGAKENPLDNASQKLQAAAYNTEMVSISLRKDVTQALDYAREAVFGKATIAKDKAAVAAREASLVVKKETSEMKAKIYAQAIRFYNKLDLVNKHRIDKLTEGITGDRTELENLLGRKATLKKEEPLYEPGQFKMPEDLQAAVNAIEGLSNKDTAAKYALFALKKKETKLERDFDRAELKRYRSYEAEFQEWNQEISFLNENIRSLEASIAKAEEKVAQQPSKFAKLMGKGKESLQERLEKNIAGLVSAASIYRDAGKTEQTLKAYTAAAGLGSSEAALAAGDIYAPKEEIGEEMA